MMTPKAGRTSETRQVPNPAMVTGAGTRHGSTAYGAAFWLSYLANAVLMTAISVLFRYADFVSHLGGGERELGAIVGVGMVGALAMRALLGVGMDRYGPRRVWLLSLLLFTAATAGHLAITTIHGPGVYLLRILLTTGIAGAIGSSLTYVSLRVPEARIAEMVGTLGTSGFLGLGLGPVLGDLLFPTATATQTQIDRMFWLAAAAGLVSALAAAAATRGQVRREVRRRQPPIRYLIRRYHPGPVLLVAAAMGLGAGLPGVFLRTYTMELHIAGIKVFFLVYASVAFTVRLCTRRLSQQIGIRRVVQLGLLAMAVSMLLYLVVRQQWQLAVPAVAAGVAHALLFPAIVAGGSISFPSRYRGLATALVLGMFDVGNLIGQPAVGNVLYYAGRSGWHKYPTMFSLVALTMVLVAAIFSLGSRHNSSLAKPDVAAGTQPPGGSRKKIDHGCPDQPPDDEAEVCASWYNDR